MLHVSNLRHVIPGQLFVTGPTDELFAFIRLDDNGVIDCRNVVDGKRTSTPVDREGRLAAPSDLSFASKRIASNHVFCQETTLD